MGGFWGRALVNHGPDIVAFRRTPSSFNGVLEITGKKNRFLERVWVRDYRYTWDLERNMYRYGLWFLTYFSCGLREVTSHMKPRGT